MNTSRKSRLARSVTSAPSIRHEELHSGLYYGPAFMQRVIYNSKPSEVAAYAITVAQEYLDHIGAASSALHHAIDQAKKWIRAVRSGKESVVPYRRYFSRLWEEARQLHRNAPDEEDRDYQGMLAYFSELMVACNDADMTMAGHLLTSMIQFVASQKNATTLSPWLHNINLLRSKTNFKDFDVTRQHLDDEPDFGSVATLLDYLQDEGEDIVQPTPEGVRLNLPGDRNVFAPNNQELARKIIQDPHLYNYLRRLYAPSRY